MRVNSACGQVGLSQVGPVVKASRFYIAYYFQLRMPVSEASIIFLLLLLLIQVGNSTLPRNTVWCIVSRF